VSVDFLLRTQLEDERDRELRRETPPGRISLTMGLVPPVHQVFRFAGPGEGDDRDANGVAPDADRMIARASSSSGQALPAHVRAHFERSLDADLSDVRVHTGAESAAAARAVGAHAYTVGKDIHFAAGRYAPSDPFGLHLLAHEVAHTVQQGGAPQVQHKLEVSTPGDAAEVEANRAADAMVAGQPAAVHAAPVIAAREGDGSAAPASGGQAPVGAGAQLTFGGELTLGESSAGPFSFKLKAKYEANGKMGQDGKTKAEGGVKAGPDSGGVVASVKTELEKKMIGDIQVKPEVKGTAELTTKGGKLQVGIAGKAKAGPIDLGALKADLTIAKWEPGKPPQVAVAAISAELPVQTYELDMGGGGKASIDAKVSLSAEITPDFAKIGEWLLEDLGAAGAVDLAVTMGASLAPLLCLASALQMASDEADLAKKVADFARDGKGAALCLSSAVMGSEAAATTPAQQQATAKGKAVAAQASAKCGLDAYKAGFTNDKGSQMHQQYDRQTRMGYEGKVREMGEQLYNSSILQRIWKTKEDVIASAMKVLQNVWP
jgi:hypothetical protein